MGDKRPTDNDREARLLKLVQSVMMRPEEQRKSFLKEQVGDDDALQKSVMEMLHQFEQSESFLEGSPLEKISLRPAPDSDVTGAWSGFLDRIGQARTVWERYLDEGEIARGGMGAIRKVRDQDLRRTLAMKLMLTQGKLDDPTRTDASLGRFLEEAQVTSQLDHPGIVPVHEIGVDERARVYFTMKLVQGDDLSKIFDRVRDPADRSWNSTRALSTLLRVCEAMAFAHAKGVIHRDLKPANVMVGAYGETYVMDWGIAKIMGREDHKDLRIRPAPASTPVKSERKDAAHATPDSPLITMDGDVFGTPAYMSPEQASGRIQEMGPHSDVYSVGAMLYQLLTGQMPYVNPRDRISPHTLLAKVLRGPPPPIDQLNRSVPAELVAICHKAMARTIPDRFSDMTQLADDLRAYLENRVVAAYESGAFAELKKWVLRNKGITATAAVAVFVLSTMLWWSFESIQSERDIAEENEQKALDERVRADQNAEEAKDRSEEATARKEEFDQLKGVVLLEEALAAEQNLYPAWPEKIAAMETWLAEDAADLLALKPTLAETISDLRGRARPTAEQDAGVSERRAWRFKEESQQFLYDTLSDLLRKIEVFDETARKDVESRLAWAKRLEELTLQHPNAVYSWEEARESIRAADGVLASELYRDSPIDLKRQLGLVPIGMNPVSLLWEFYHLRTAYDPASGLDPADIEIPEHAEDGSLTVQDGTGLVFVLIPGGTFWMGAQPLDPEGRNYDPQAESDEAPAHEVTLDPYLLSRYEMTQGQWLRLSGETPSRTGPHNYNTNWNVGRREADLTHPVEQVSWADCVSHLGRVGLMLPAERQWEFACRAGTRTPWWTGSELLDLDEAGNLSDQYGKTHGNLTWSAWEPELDDGNTLHAKVGTYRANPFGLHDTIGNVWEWCLDDYAGYSDARGAGEGARVAEDGQSRAGRGGCFYSPARDARSASRGRNTPTFRNDTLGCRPARPVHR